MRIDEFILHLFKESKIRFVFLIGFIASTIFINYKWGITLYPIVHYGMYSAVEKMNQPIFIQKLYVDDFPLTEDKLSQYQSEELCFYTNNYYRNLKYKEHYNSVVITLLKRMKLDFLIFKSTSSNSSSEIEFLERNRLHMEGIYKMPLKTISYKSIEYKWTGQKLEKCSQ